MLKLTVLDAMSLPGSATRPNEDSFGQTADCAFVIDGATGLGPNLLVANHDSDAAWLAAFARVHFEEMVQPGRRISDIVRHVNQLASRIVDYAAAGETIPGWQLPVAGFTMVRIEKGAAYVHALGDCVLIAVDSGGNHFVHTAIRGSAAAEREAARMAVAAAGGLSAHASLAGHEETRNALRESRARFNKPGALWTLGTVPDAADHISTQAIPLKPPFTGLVMTDGYSALTDNYKRYTAPELVRMAEGHGLAALGEELRHVETVEDPDGAAYPRFKVSDDATAVLFRVH